MSQVEEEIIAEEIAEEKESRRLLPDQEVNAHLYLGNPQDYPLSLLRFCQRGLEPIPELAEVTPKFSLEDMASSPLQINFLRLLLKMGQYKRVLEIGTFMGRTTLALASELPPDGKVITIEKGEEFAAIAQKNFLASHHGSKIELIQGDALEILPRFKGKEKFDFVYLDGAKQLYLELFRSFGLLMERGGLLVADDIFFHGDALNNPPQTDKGEGVKSLVKFMTSIVDLDWRVSILPMGNGLLLGYRQK